MAKINQQRLMAVAKLTSDISTFQWQTNDTDFLVSFFLVLYFIFTFALVR